MHCKINGENGPAVLCGHLVQSGMPAADRIGWAQAEFDAENGEPGDLMAWCINCD